MKIYPLVSVIIPTIGRDTLERAIDSILATKYPALEILISANQTELIALKNRLSKYLNEVQLVFWTFDKIFPSIAKNNALTYSQGKYVTFLDDDDTALDAKFFDLVEYLENHSGVFAVFGQYDVRDCYTNEIKNKNCGGHPKVCFDTLLQNNYIASGSIMYRNDNDLIFDDSVEFGEEWMLNLNLLGIEHKIAYLPISTYIWTQNLISGYTATFTKNNINWRKIVEENRKRAKELWG